MPDNDELNDEDPHSEDKRSGGDDEQKWSLKRDPKRPSKYATDPPPSSLSSSSGSSSDHKSSSSDDEDGPNRANRDKHKRHKSKSKKGK